MVCPTEDHTIRYTVIYIVVGGSTEDYTIRYTVIYIVKGVHSYGYSTTYGWELILATVS